MKISAIPSGSYWMVDRSRFSNLWHAFGML
jgi:hypothetical protein